MNTQNLNEPSRLYRRLFTFSLAFNILRALYRNNWNKTDNRVYVFRPEKKQQKTIQITVIAWSSQQHWNKYDIPYVVTACLSQNHHENMFILFWLP